MRNIDTQNKKGCKFNHCNLFVYYERFADFNFILPYQFLLLCRLMDLTPQEALTDFMDNLSCGSWKREGRDTEKEHLINYFIAHGYGQEHYTEADIREIFKEMDAVGLLFPRESNGKMVDRYAKWRDKHETWWFKKWFRKPRHTKTASHERINRC